MRLPEHGEENPECLKYMESALALLVYDNPEESPFGHMLLPSQRHEVSCILTRVFFAHLAALRPPRCLAESAALRILLQGGIKVRRTTYFVQSRLFLTLYGPVPWPQLAKCCIMNRAYPRVRFVPSLYAWLWHCQPAIGLEELKYHAAATSFVVDSYVRRDIPWLCAYIFFFNRGPCECVNRFGCHCKRCAVVASSRIPYLKSLGIVGLLRSESPSGKCAKLHSVAASNNRDHTPCPLYYCLFAPHIYGWYPYPTSCSWWIAHSTKSRSWWIAHSKKQ